MFEKLKKSTGGFECLNLDSERKKILQQLIDYINFKIEIDEPIALNFICTHNSRRSHLAQIWAQTAAAYYKIPNVKCYSGGTEATAVFPIIASTLADQGFEVTKEEKEINPRYTFAYAEDQEAIIAFSKTFDDLVNPKENFAAVMTCSDADQNCPMILGSDIRIPITYLDPKAFDESPNQKEKYLEKSKEIAAEMFYVFNMASRV